MRRLMLQSTWCGIPSGPHGVGRCNRGARPRRGGWRRSCGIGLTSTAWKIPRRLFLGRTSPAFGVRVKMDGVTVWAGLLDTPRFRQWPVQQVTIIALGVISTLRQPVSVAGLASSSISTIAKAVVTAAGLGASYVGGDKVLNQWPGILDQVALNSLQELEETEESFLFERLDGELALETENARSTGASAMSALTLTDQIQVATDVPLLRGSYLDSGFKQIANVINVPVATLAESGEITLVSSPDVVIPAGSTRSIIYSYPSASSPSSHRAAASWVAPVSGTDYTARTGLTLTGAVVGEAYEVTFANTSAASITVDDLELRGKALVAGTTIIVPSKDSDSILKFKEREYLRPSKLFTEIGPAQEYADGRVSRHKDPVGWLVALWPAYYAPEEARSLDLSRRITVEKEGGIKEYFIEGASITMRGFARMEYLLSPVPGKTRPSAPVVTVENVAGETTHLAVSWSDPYNGGSVITGYDVRYKKSTDMTWTAWPHTGTGRTTTITGLEQGGISYDVQVLATNAQGDSPWSVSGVGSTESTVPSQMAKPTLVLYIGDGSGSLRVYWVEPYNGGQIISRYEIRGVPLSSSRREYEGDIREGLFTSIADARHGVASNMNVAIRAENSVGWGAWSEYANVSWSSAGVITYS